MRFLSTCVVLLALDACVLTPSTGYGRACDVDADCDDGDACDVARGFCVPGDAVEGEGEGEGDVGEGEGEGEGEGDEGEGEGDVGEGEGEGEVDFFRVQPLPPQVVDEDAELVVAVTVDNPPAGSLVQLAASSANGALA